MAVATASEQCPWCGSSIPHAKFVEIETRIRGEEKRRVDAERVAIETKLKAAHETAVAEHAKKLADELARARELLKTDFDKQMVKLVADATREKDELAKKLAELQHRLDAKGGRDDASDVDVYDELKTEFDGTGDKIVRVPEGEGAADVIHEVVYKGAVCGRILVDTKNRKKWQSNYATKLHNEALDSKADHAILATTTLPKDQRELSEEDGVLLAHPSLVVGLVTLLRRDLIAMHRGRLSTEKRAEKKAKLYDYVTSEAFRQKLAEPGHIAKALEELEVEQKTHLDRIVKKRGAILKKLENVVAEVAGEIAELVEGDES